MLEGYVLALLCALAGFGLSLFLTHKKRAKEKVLVCPLRGNCTAVIQSDYSTFLGVPVELLGIAYYGVVALAYLLLVLVPSQLFGVSVLLLAVGAAAFLFSLYLTFIQLMVLRQVCTWCLASAFLSTVLFSVSILGAPEGIADLLRHVHPVILAFHLLAMAVGLGGATFTDVFFFRFLKDFRISEIEADVMRTISQVIWLALAVIVLTGIALFIPNATVLLASAKFLMKMVVVAVLIVNGTILSLLIAPRLMHISFGEDHMHQKGELRRLRRISFALGSVSFVSWYSAFTLGILRDLPFSFPLLLAIYLLLLCIGMTGSQIVERSLARRALHTLRPFS